MTETFDGKKCTNCCANSKRYFRVYPKQETSIDSKEIIMGIEIVYENNPFSRESVICGRCRSGFKSVLRLNNHLREIKASLFNNQHVEEADSPNSPSRKKAKVDEVVKNSPIVKVR